MAKDTRTRMLETTARLLQHRGYFGTALSDILARATRRAGRSISTSPAARTSW